MRVWRDDPDLETRICNYLWSMTFISFRHLACIIHPRDKANLKCMLVWHLPRVQEGVVAQQ